MHFLLLICGKLTRAQLAHQIFLSVISEYLVSTGHFNGICYNIGETYHALKVMKNGKVEKKLIMFSRSRSDNILVKLGSPHRQRPIDILRVAPKWLQQQRQF
jgi:hypothetical protein